MAGAAAGVAGRHDAERQDEQANWPRFGGPSTATADGRRLRGAFPQVRLLALAECGTRALVAAVHGAYSAGEKTLARELLDRLGDGMLVLADRNFACWELWRDAAATGAELLWRIGASFSLPVDEVLADGTYLSRLKAPRKLPKAGLLTSPCGSWSTGSRTRTARSPRRSP